MVVFKATVTINGYNKNENKNKNTKHANKKDRWKNLTTSTENRKCL